MVQTAWGVSFITDGGWLQGCDCCRHEFEVLSTAGQSYSVFDFVSYNVILETDVSLCCLPAQSEQTPLWATVSVKASSRQLSDPG